MTELHHVNEAGDRRTDTHAMLSRLERAGISPDLDLKSTA